MYGEYFKNEYPFEKLVKMPDENEIIQIVANCDYTIECDSISAKENRPDINIADAVVFYQMGFEACKKQIESKLKPIQL